MWNPIEGDKQCSWCKEIKPVSTFSLQRNGDGNYRPHSHCKKCRNDRAKMRLQTGIRKDRPKPGAMGETSPYAWKVPRDDRPVREKMLDSEFRRWPAPVAAERTQLRWAA